MTTQEIGDETVQPARDPSHPDAAERFARIRERELLWGEGYLSPGGDAEVDKIVDGLEIFGKTVLDIGCGVGGPSRRLVEKHQAARLTAFDVDAVALDHARSLFQQREMTGRVEAVLGDGLGLPFADKSFDLVFSKDAIVHVADKAAMYAEIFRVLKPGGWLAVSDWYGSSEPPTAEMTQQVKTARAPLVMQSIEEAAAALSAVGFIGVTKVDRNAWFVDETRAELERVEGSERAGLIETLGAEAAEAWIERTRQREVVAAQGQLRPGHLRARRPS